MVGALLLLSPCAEPITRQKNDEETRHPTHQRYRWWSGLLKGAVAGASPTDPWTDRRTGVRTPDHDERQPWRIPLDRPCLLSVLALDHLCFSAILQNILLVGTQVFIVTTEELPIAGRHGPRSGYRTPAARRQGY